MWRVVGVPNPSVGSLQGRGAEVCWVRKLLRRGYDAAPVEDLHFDRVAGHHPGVSRIVTENGVGAEAQPIALG